MDGRKNISWHFKRNQRKHLGPAGEDGGRRKLKIPVALTLIHFLKASQLGCEGGLTLRKNSAIEIKLAGSGGRTSIEANIEHPQISTNYQSFNFH
jgi:hypothetical protein